MVDWERPRVYSAVTQAGDKAKRPPTVSMWRRILVVREWIRIQTYRRVPIVYLLILMLVFNVGSSWRTLSVAYPSMTTKAQGTTNPVLLFAVDSLVWFVGWVVIMLVKTQLFERFLGSSLYQFVDMTSLANISVFGLDRLFHGYYIHGRSVHSYADTDITELTSFLSREQQNLVAKRGLNASDQQTFDVYLNVTIRRLLDQLLSVVDAPVSSDVNVEADCVENEWSGH
jgi:meckelin